MGRPARGNTIIYARQGPTSRRKASLHFADLVLDRLRIDLEEIDVRRRTEFNRPSGGFCERDYGLRLLKMEGSVRPHDQHPK